MTETAAHPPTVVERYRKHLDSPYGRELHDLADVTILACELRELVALADREQPAERQDAVGSAIAAGTPLNTLKINGHIYGRLWRAGITTIGALAANTPGRLLGLDGVGAGTVAGVENFLAAHGYRLADEPPPDASTTWPRTETDTRTGDRA